MLPTHIPFYLICPYAHLGVIFSSPALSFYHQLIVQLSIFTDILWNYLQYHYHTLPSIYNTAEVLEILIHMLFSWLLALPPCLKVILPQLPGMTPYLALIHYGYYIHFYPYTTNRCIRVIGIFFAPPLSPFLFYILFAYYTNFDIFSSYIQPPHLLLTSGILTTKCVEFPMMQCHSLLCFIILYVNIIIPL